MTLTKIQLLGQIITGMDSVLVAFSGGVDSTFLLKTALDTLGAQKVLAVTASSETYPTEERQLAKKLADFLGARHIDISTLELRDERFSQNPPERCYYCKTELFRKLLAIAQNNSLAFVVDGANADDAHDFRPGMKAGSELGIRSPLREAGLTKDEIRSLAKVQGLPNWDKPSMPCLSSRFPYGHRITVEKLGQVEEAERYLRDCGFSELRVRHHGDIARIEVPGPDITRLAEEPLRSQIINKLYSLGFSYITVDLKGFRSGSMNEVLPKEILNG